MTTGATSGGGSGAAATFFARGAGDLRASVSPPMRNDAINMAASTGAPTASMIFCFTVRDWFAGSACAATSLDVLASLIDGRAAISA